MHKPTPFAMHSGLPLSDSPDKIPSNDARVHCELSSAPVGSSCYTFATLAALYPAPNASAFLRQSDAPQPRNTLGRFRFRCSDVA